MKKQNKDNLKELVVKQFEKYPQMEHGVNVLKAALSAIPFGGIFSSLISDYMPKTKMERLLKFIGKLGEDLARFKREIDEKYIKTDKFSYLLEKTLKAVIENYQEEKMACFRAILVNSLRNKSTSQERKEFFLNLVDNLTVTNLSILAKIHEISEKDKTSRMNFATIMAKTKGNGPLFIMANMRALEQYNLIEITVPPIPAADYGNYAIRYTRLGEEFLKFISTPSI